MGVLFEGSTNHGASTMRISSHLHSPLALAGLLGLGAARAALGCAYHSALDVQLASMHVGSISVAVALRKAADSGVIDAKALEGPSTSTTGSDESVRGLMSRAVRYNQAVSRLEVCREVLAASPAVAELPASFSLGFVESRLWSRYSQCDGELGVDIHTDGPAEGEAVVLTGEPVLMALLAGTLSIDRALADRMILIDGDQRAKAVIRRALESTTWQTESAEADAATTSIVQSNTQEVQR